MNDFASRLEAASAPTHLPAGAYTAVVKRALIGNKNFHANDKRRYVDWEFVVDSGAFKNRRLWSKNFIDAKPGGGDPLGVLLGQIKSLGLTPSKESLERFIDDLAVQLEGVLDRRVNLEVKEKEWEGKVRNDVKVAGFASDLIGQESGEGDVPQF